MTPADFAVQTEMLANEAQLSRGRPLPVWITESNYSLADTELGDPVKNWTRRVLPYERVLLGGVLPQADKIAGNLVHDLHARAYTILPRGADDPDPIYWLLWVLRDLRGRRILAQTTSPGVTSFASLEEDRVTAVVFNDTAAAQAVRLKVSLPGGWWTGPEVRAIAPDEKRGVAPLRLTLDCKRDGPRAEGVLDLQAYATASVSFRLDSFAQPPREVVRQEFFGDRTLQLLAGTEPARVHLPRPPAADTVRLRIGLLGPSPEDKLRATFNGMEVRLTPAAWQELPLEATVVRDENVLEVARREPGSNPRLALAFAALVTETRR